jgi:MFS family permease
VRVAIRLPAWVLRALPRATVQPDAIGAPGAATGALLAEEAASAPPKRFQQTFRALRNRNYRLYYYGQMISLSGTWMQTIAQAWLVLQITNSKIALGTVTMLQFLPITIFVLFAGVIADRVPKRNFLFVTQSVAMSQAFALTVLVWSGHVQLWHVYLLAPVLGLANAFEQPTRQALVVDLVGKEDVVNAVALNAGMFNAARLVGPAIGGFIIATVGVKAAFLLNGISFFPVIAALVMMRTSEMYTSQKRATSEMHPLAELREGLAYAFRTPAALLIVILIAIVGTFGYNFTVMLPLIDRYVLHRGSVGLGFLTAALGLGSVIAALLLASREAATKRTLFVGGTLFVIALGAVAFSHWYVLTLVLLLLMGVFSTAFHATANTSMQLTSPDRLRGRVMALYMLLFAGSTPIGGFLTGFMAQQLGVPAAVGICAALSGVGIALGFLYYMSHRDEIPEVAGG